VQWPADLTARAAGGSIDGHVTVVTRPSRRLSSAGAYPGRIVTVAPSGGGSELPNVIVFVDLPKRVASAPRRVTIRQTDEVFTPRVAAITTGSTVDFPNDDPIFHNVFSLSRAATFDLGRYPRGESKRRRFDKPGVVKVFCHLHSHMTALVRVFDHPHFARLDATGRFLLPGVPPGRHRVVAWHERVGEVVLEATVTEGGTVSLTFSLPLIDTP
jgi:plastocyanin